MKRPRIILADDHGLLLEAFKKFLEPEFEVVGTAKDGRALIAAAAELKPDAIVVDISMPLLNGLDAGRIVKQLLPSVKLIYLTMNPDPELVREAFRIGASGFLLKTSEASELLMAVRAGLQGRSYVTPLIERETSEALGGDHKRRDRAGITMRQREVLRLLAEGRSMKEAAFILGVTPRTVAFHKYQVMENLNLRSNAELLQFAIKQCLV